MPRARTPGSTTSATIRANRSSVSNRGSRWKAMKPMTSSPASATRTCDSATENRSIRAARSLAPAG